LAETSFVPLRDETISLPAVFDVLVNVRPVTENGPGFSL